MYNIRLIQIFFNYFDGVSAERFYNLKRYPPQKGFLVLVHPLEDY